MHVVELQKWPYLQTALSALEGRALERKGVPQPTLLTNAVPPSGRAYWPAAPTRGPPPTPHWPGGPSINAQAHQVRSRGRQFSFPPLLPSTVKSKTKMSLELNPRNGAKPGRRTESGGEERGYSRSGSCVRADHECGKSSLQPLLHSVGLRPPSGTGSDGAHPKTVRPALPWEGEEEGGGRCSRKVPPPTSQSQ